MKKLPQILLLSTLSLGILSPLAVKAETSDAADNTTPTTVETIPSSDSDMLENTGISEPVKNTSETATENTEMTKTANADSTESSTKSSTVESMNSNTEDSLSSNKPVDTSTKTREFTTASDGSVTVTTWLELSEAAKQPIPEGQDALVINLANDIQLTKSSDYTTNRVNFTKNTIVNGHGHSIYQVVENADSIPLQATTNNIYVTYNDINFGTPTYSTWTWYGMLTQMGSNQTFNVNNVTYNIKKGSQPFYSKFDTSSGNILNFTGTNVINSDGNSYEGEFAENLDAINVKSGKTTVTRNSSSTGFTFLTTRTSNGSIHVYKDAELTVDGNYRSISSKDYTSATSNQLDIIVDENGTFKFTNQRTSSWYPFYTATTNMNVNKNGTFVLSSPNTSMDFYQSSYIYNIIPNQSKLIQIDSNTALLRANTIYVKPENLNYPATLDILASTQSNLSSVLLDHEFTGTDNGSYTPNATTKKYTLMRIIPGLPENGNQAVTDTIVSGGVSELTASIGTDDATKAVTDIHYKISNKALTTGDITTDSNQTTITNATGLLLDTTKKSTYGQPVTTAESEVTLDKLKPGKYYVYTQLSDTHDSSYIIKSKWAVKEVTIAPFISVSVPLKTMSFSSYKAGTFGLSENLKPGKITSGSNIPINIIPSNLKTNSGSDESISLVDSFSNQTEGLLLNLNAAYDLKQSQPDEVWEALQLGELSYNNPVELSEFWNPKPLTNLYVSGEYRSTVRESRNVSYTLSYTISQAQ